MSIFLFFQEIIEGKRKGVFISFLKVLLRFFSFFWGGSSSVKNFLYDHHLLKTQKTSSCVISIGNIVAGGTGKTPLTLLLGKTFENVSTAILSRGYRSCAEKQKTISFLYSLLSPLPSWKEVGDEPLLFAKKLKNILIFSGKNRLLSAKLAQKKGVQLLLLDDGFQYRRLFRDFDIVLLNGNDLFGKGAFLPSGFLRESPKSLKRAHLLLIHHVQNKEHFSHLKKQLLPYTSCPIIGIKTIATALVDLEGQESPLPSSIFVGAFCAIAHPDSFFCLLKEKGLIPIAARYSADHNSFSVKELEDFANQAIAKGASFLVCTEKDWVKIDKSLKLPLPLFALKTEVDFVEGKELWEDFLKKIEEKIPKI